MKYNDKALFLQEEWVSHPKDKAKSRAIGRRKATDLVFG